jgi:hypothetical protein
LFVCLFCKDKWQLSLKEWPWKALPYYAMGSGYLIAGTAIHPLLAAAQVVPFHKFEDVYVTSLCAGISHNNLTRIINFI